MSLWRQLRRGLRALTHRTAADQDVADELAHFLDQSIASFEERGLSAEDARRAARREVGNVTALSEQVRSSGWEHVIETIATDLRHSARRLRNSPGFTAVSVITTGGVPDPRIRAVTTG